MNSTQGWHSRPPGSTEDSAGRGISSRSRRLKGCGQRTQSAQEHTSEKGGDINGILQCLPELWQQPGPWRKVRLPEREEPAGGKGRSRSGNSNRLEAAGFRTQKQRTADSISIHLQTQPKEDKAPPDGRAFVFPIPSRARLNLPGKPIRYPPGHRPR